MSEVKFDAVEPSLAGANGGLSILVVDRVDLLFLQFLGNLSRGRAGHRRTGLDRKPGQLGHGVVTVVPELGEQAGAVAVYGVPFT